MPRKMRNTAILAAVETTIGTAATLTAANAILISEASVEYEYRNAERNLLRPYFGHSGQLVGTRNVKIAFTCEMFGSGTAGTAPAWGSLLLGCAFAEVTTASQRVEYTPATTGLKTLTIAYNMDGVTHLALGCMGDVNITMQEGDRPTFQFTFTGIDGGATVAATPATSFTAWAAPLVINSANTAKVNFGGTYATGAVTGGTALCSRGFTVNMANEVRFQAMVGCQYVDIADRKPTSSIELELTPAEEVAMRTAINTNTKTSMSLLHGTTAGARVLVFAPQVMRTNPRYSEFEGAALVGMDLAIEPLAGNDEIRIVSL